MPAPADIWTAGRVALLRDLWERGLAASGIVRLVNQLPGQPVAGMPAIYNKVRALRLPRRPKDTRAANQAAAQATRTKAAAKRLAHQRPGAKQPEIRMSGSGGAAARSRAEIRAELAAKHGEAFAARVYGEPL